MLAADRQVTIDCRLNVDTIYEILPKCLLANVYNLLLTRYGLLHVTRLLLTYLRLTTSQLI